jgi:NADPH2:quinone reductase
MKAVLVRAFGRIETIDFADCPDPVPGPGEVVLRLLAAEVNYPDILVVEGRYQVKPPLPFIPGKTAVGIVAAVGAGVGNVAIGDRVLAHLEYGAFAELVRAPAAICCPMPAAMASDEAAALGLAAQTAYFALGERGGLCAGETVLVLGGGGAVGSAAIPLARAMGAARVFATARGDSIARARALGADHVVDTARPDLAEALRAEILAVNGGAGVDVVVDSLGGDVTQAALRCMAWGGRLVIVGFTAGAPPLIRANYLLVKHLAAIGLHWSDYRERRPDAVRAAQAAIFAHVAAGRLPVTIVARFPLAEAAHALAQQRAATPAGRIILTTERT